MTVLDKVIELTAEAFQIPIETVTPDMDLYTDSGDSLNQIELLMSVEEVFELERLGEFVEQSPNLTVRQPADFIESKQA